MGNNNRVNGTCTECGWSGELSGQCFPPGSRGRERFCQQCLNQNGQELAAAIQTAWDKFRRHEEARQQQQLGVARAALGRMASVLEEPYFPGPWIEPLRGEAERLAQELEEVSTLDAGRESAQRTFQLWVDVLDFERRVFRSEAKWLLSQVSGSRRRDVSRLADAVRQELQRVDEHLRRREWDQATATLFAARQKARRSYRLATGHGRRASHRARVARPSTGAARRWQRKVDALVLKAQAILLQVEGGNDFSSAGRLGGVLRRAWAQIGEAMNQRHLGEEGAAIRAAQNALREAHKARSISQDGRGVDPLVDAEALVLVYGASQDGPDYDRLRREARILGIPLGGVGGLVGVDQFGREYVRSKLVADSAALLPPDYPPYRNKSPQAKRVRGRAGEYHFADFLLQLGYDVFDVSDWGLPWIDFLVTCSAWPGWLPVEFAGWNKSGERPPGNGAAPLVWIPLHALTAAGRSTTVLAEEIKRQLEEEVSLGHVSWIPDRRGMPDLSKLRRAH